MKNIIIIDDNEELLYLLKYRLDKEGISAQVFNKPEHAIISATLHRPELVICDYKMPKFNGLEVHEQMNKNPFERPIPFVILSGADDRRQQIERQGVKYISKTENFGDVIDELLGLAEVKA